jgi:hypothetical protein
MVVGTTDIGPAGGVVTEFDESEGALLRRLLLVATTENVYVVAGARLGTIAEFEVWLVCTVAPPGDAVTV